MSFSEFLEQLGIDYHCLPAHTNPYFPTANLNHWSCKLVLNERFAIFPFSTDLTFRRWKLPEDPDLWSLVVNRKIGQPYDGPYPFFNSFEEQAQYEECSEPIPPSLKLVLRTLGRDVAVFESAPEQLKDDIARVGEYQQQLVYLLQDKYQHFLSFFLKKS